MLDTDYKTFLKNMTGCKWCTIKHTIPVEASELKNLLQDSWLSNMLFSDGSRLMLEGLQQQTCNETEENVCSERPALAVPRLQTSFLLNTPLQPSSTHIHNPSREYRAYSEGCDGEPNSNPSTAVAAAALSWPALLCYMSANWIS